MRALPSNFHSRLCLETPPEELFLWTPLLWGYSIVLSFPQYRGFLRDYPLGGFLRQSLKWSLRQSLNMENVTSPIKIKIQQSLLSALLYPHLPLQSDAPKTDQTPILLGETSPL